MPGPWRIASMVTPKAIPFSEGGAPSSVDCSRSEKFFVRQDRAGIKRDYATHGAADSMLYTASQVRPAQRRVSGDGKVAIGILAELPAPLAIPAGTILPLGSMGRAASCVEIDAGKLDLSSHSVKATAINPAAITLY